MPAPPTSGIWCGMDSSASKIVSALDHVEGVLLRGTNCLILARPAAPVRRRGTPRAASSTRKEFGERSVHSSSFIEGNF